MPLTVSFTDLWKSDTNFHNPYFSCKLAFASLGTNCILSVDVNLLCGDVNLNSHAPDLSLCLFVLQDDILYRRSLLPDGPDLLLVVLANLRPIVLAQLHEMPTLGHLRLSRTYSCARCRSYWPRMCITWAFVTFVSAGKGRECCLSTFHTGYFTALASSWPVFPTRLCEQVGRHCYRLWDAVCHTCALTSWATD